MTNTVESVTSELKSISVDAKRTFGHLSGEKLNWRPSETAWSVGQCFEHLIKTNSSFYDAFDRIASGTRKNTFWETWSPLTGVGGRFLINTIKNDSKKVKAPSRSIVPPSEIAPDIIDRFAGHLDEVIGKVAATETADWRRTVVTSPFIRVMTYTLDDGYTIMIEHNRRHFRQAERVMQSKDFPK